MPAQHSSIRPIGLGSTVWKVLGRELSAPATAAPVAAPASPRPGDTLQVSGSPFANRRFAAHADLAAVFNGQVLRPGDTSAGIAAVQRALIDQGFVVPGGASGYYGAQTQQALSNFQNAAGLEADGILGPKTMKALDRYAPAPGKTAWDPGSDRSLVPNPVVAPGKKARVVIAIGQHRAFSFDKSGNLIKIYGVRTGRDGHADGRGGATKPGVRVVDGKNSDPTEISRRLWPESEGKAFGTRLIDLNMFDPVTGKRSDAYAGQELHGTYQEASIGRDFSHGCVGVTNADIEYIYENLKVGDFVRFDR